MPRRLPIIIQARLSSTRAPGKVLRPIAGRPLLGLLLDRMRRVEDATDLVVATSERGEDDAIVRFCDAEGIAVARGPLADVAGRFANVVTALEAEAFVRISGDSPWLDPALIDQALDLYHRTGPDLVSNVHPRSFPKGQSVEVVNAETFLAELPNLTSAADREHVTSYFYAHADRFRITAFQADRPAPEVQLSVDSEADFRACVALTGRLTRPHWTYGWPEIAELARESRR